MRVQIRLWCLTSKRVGSVEPQAIPIITMPVILRRQASCHFTQNKTKATQASVDAYFASIADEGRRRDCEALADVDPKVLEKMIAASWAAAKSS